MSSQYRMLDTALSFSVRTDVLGIESVRPLIVDLSQPGRTIIMRTRRTSTLVTTNEIYFHQAEGVINSLLSASRRPSTASNREPTGLWPIREVWQSGGPLEAVFVDFFAPGSRTTDTDKPGGISYALTARIDESASKGAEEEQTKQTNPFEFINISDPDWRARARSHLTRQQRRVGRKGDASMTPIQHGDVHQNLEVARKGPS